MSDKEKKPPQRNGGGTFVEELDYALGPDEIHERAMRVVAIDAEIDKLELEKSEANRKVKLRVDTLLEERSTKSKAALEGREKRMVECREFPEFERCTVRIIRTDTNEVVRERPMEEEERAALMQPSLPIGESQPVEVRE